MANQPTAEELLVRVRARDREALGELYDRYAPGLLGVLARMLGGRKAADQALQSVLHRFWDEARHYVTGGASVAMMLVLEARAAAVEKLRARRPPAGLNHANNQALAWLPRPLEIALLDERRELLKKMVNQLPHAQRQALDLAVFEGCTESEIAARLGEPLGKTRSELRAAMLFLRHRLRAVMGTWTADI